MLKKWYNIYIVKEEIKNFPTKIKNAAFNLWTESKCQSPKKLVAAIIDLKPRMCYNIYIVKGNTIVL